MHSVHAGMGPLILPREGSREGGEERMKKKEMQMSMRLAREK